MGEELKKIDADFEAKKRSIKEARKPPATDTFATVYTRELPEIKPKKKSQGVATDDLQFAGWASINHKSSQGTKELESVALKPDKTEHQRLFVEQMTRKLEKKEPKPYKKSEAEVHKENIKTFDNNKQAAVAHKKMVEKSKIMTNVERFDKLISN